MLLFSHYGISFTYLSLCLNIMRKETEILCCPGITINHLILQTYLEDFNQKWVIIVLKIILRNW